MIVLVVSPSIRQGGHRDDGSVHVGARVRQAAESRCSHCLGLAPRLQVSSFGSEPVCDENATAPSVVVSLNHIVSLEG